MANGVLFDIAGEIIKVLSSPALEEFALCWGVNDEVERLKETVSTIQAVLLDADKKQAHNEQVKDWLGKLKEAVFEADDLLDDFATEVLRRKVMSGSKIKKEVRLFFSGSNQLVYGLKMGHKIKAIRKKLDGAGEDRSKFNLEVNLVQRGAGYKMRDQTDSSTPEFVTGRQGDKEALLQMVLDSNNADNVSVISIVGLGGLGKTTLAQLIFNDERVNSCFDLKLWVCVSENFDVKVIVQKILESIIKKQKKSEEMELDTLKSLLGEKIKGKKYLLVLDDVWNQEGEKWDTLKKILKDGASGSKIMVTTRLASVAKLTSTVEPYNLKGLSDDEAWSLFKRVAFGAGQAPKNLSLEEVRSIIVKRCGGVPLAIKSIGRMLSFKDSKEEWLSFSGDDLSSLKQGEGDIMPTLKLSYDHLPSHLKQCFAYCCLFPKDYRINVDTLIQLWIAQGFVPREERKCLEDIGFECFKDLLWRSFFQEVEYDKWGNIEYCKMHDLMHDLATSVGKGESYLVPEDGGIDIRGNFRHASFGFNLISSEQIPTELSSKAKCLRTFLLPCQARFGNDRVESKVREALLHDFRGLRALDLRKLALEKLPASWGMKLKHLRYLDLSDNENMRVLPNSITKLKNLEVLKLLGCKSLTELPKDIRKLKNLRCLDCKDCTSLKYMPPGLGQLTSLRRLTVFVVDEGSGSSGASKHKYESGGLEELYGLNNLRGSLEIKTLGNVRNGEREFEDANLKGKNLLQSLHLDWGRDIGYNWAVADIDYEERCFQRLQPHPNLEGLEVFRYGGVRFPSWFSSLTNLVKIRFEGCGRCQCVPPFHRFPSLQELEIVDLSELEYMVVEENDGEITKAESSSSSTFFFPSLKSLSFFNCPKLKGWWKNQAGDYDDGNNSATSTSGATVLLKLPHFHRLSKFEIWRCPNLTQMPLFPSVTDHLYLWETSLEPLRQTMEMKRSSTMATSSFSSSATLVMHPPPLSDLKEMWLAATGDLESLPEEWLQNLTSLQELRIYRCPNLKSLPQGMKHHLTSLRTLEIVACPQLEKRCGNKGGADWPVISHIPNVSIDGKYIQRDGQYSLDDEEA